jgi:hypothetical protein
MQDSMKARFAVAFCLFLAACGGVEREDTYDTDKSRSSRYENGSVATEKGGFSLFGDRESNKKSAGATGLGVNAFLWRAALDTLSFMPVSAADPFGGTIITDWYAPPSAPNERVKVNVYILSRDLRADGVRVAVFRQERDTAGGWVDSNTNIATAGTMEDAILTRARQMRVKQIGEERATKK